ncbi:hypothetical protein [Kaustia mangrovi]|uniref:hypothetical protein n=1 Tax=Kaustia mangrovi TaxID=2593653 RepID=UPI001FE33F93|nr:hypothetical protein [Kaustia mangrovi]
MPRIADLLDAIVAELGALDGIEDCDRHGGRFDVAELKRFAVKAPAIRVAALGIRAVSQVDTGEQDARLRIGAFIATKDRPERTRDDAALAYVQRVIETAQLGRWGQLKVHPARDLTAESLYSGEVQTTGIALWGVVWTQTVRIGDPDTEIAP